MMSIGAVLAAALLPSEFFLGDIFGFELEIMSSEVKFKPMTEEEGGGRSHCLPGHPKKIWC